MTPNLSDMAGRLEALERDCRRWKRIGAASLATVGILMLAGAQPGREKVITAESIRIVDQKGRGRIVLSAGEDMPDLTFYDQTEEERLVLGITKDNFPVIYFSEGGKTRLSMGLVTKGAPIFSMHDSEDRRRISMGVYAKGGPSFRILDEANKAVFRSP